MKKNIIKSVALVAVVSSALLCISNHQTLINRVLHPGYGSCGKCNRTWDVVESHSTTYEWSKPGEMHMLTSGENVTADKIFGSNTPPELAEYLSKPQPVRGCFPLCKNCWLELKTPEARLPYYRTLLDEWNKDDAESEQKWEGMKASVLAGN